MLTTQEISKKYKVTRQTLNNWIRKGYISQPPKNLKSAYEWTIKNEKEIENALYINKNVNNKKKNNEKLFIGNRRYLGSKQKMLDFIERVVDENLTDIETVADIFGGTGIVADLFRKKGKKIIVNDLLYSNYISYHTWFSNEKIDTSKIKDKISELNNQVPVSGYVHKNFGGTYFSYDNSKKIDAIREKIESYTDLNFREYAMLITSLIYAMDKVANTVGHYDAYRKKMDSLSPITLKIPEYNINTNNEIFNKDANKLVKEIYADLVYIDTPYNSRGYENAYHVLENISEWKKPEVEGVAKKAVNRSEKTSEYTKKDAPLAFDDLIQNIKSKYILVSYNNMNKKGNSRSNAKISNEEIISSLKKRGTVEIFEIDFNPFTTGKSKIKNHKELLYLCKINKEKKNVVQKKLVKGALNYTGNKYKLLPQLMSKFPKNYSKFIDLFSGGATVGINVANTRKKSYVEYILNDINSEVIDLYKYFSINNIDDILKKIRNAIVHYGLSNTYENGYEFYNLSSATGLSKYNKEKFLKLREDYNKKNYKVIDKSILFYLLIIFGFNNQIRFNKYGEFNLPVGKRDFNKNMKNKLIEFHNALVNNEFKILNLDFRKLNNEVTETTFLYADPPYRITNATYNENLGWTIKDDLDLFEFLDVAHSKGAKFALSNVILHNGKENLELLSWADKYNIHFLNSDYNNSNYQSKAKKNTTIEVLITNY